MKTVTIGDIAVGNDLPLTLIAGPCQLESLLVSGKVSLLCQTQLQVKVIAKVTLLRLMLHQKKSKVSTKKN